MLDYKSVIVDGELICGSIIDEFGEETYQFERRMRKTGYPLCPKLNGYGCKEDPSITKQDLIDHPDWFEPYKFPFIVIKSWGGDWKYEECIEAFRYKDGKWAWDDSKSPNPCVVVGNQANASEIMAQDVAYMKQWYPELYKKVLELNGLQEDDSGNLIPAAPQQNGKPHKPKPSVPPKQPQPTNQTPTTPQQGKSHTSKPTAPGAKKSNTAGQTPVITRMNKPDTQDPEPPVTETITGNTSQMSDTSVLMGTKCKLASEPDGPKQTTVKSPVIVVPTNDDVMQMARTLSAAMKARMFTMSSRDEMTKFAEELAGVLQEGYEEPPASISSIIEGAVEETVAETEPVVESAEPAAAQEEVVEQAQPVVIPEVVTPVTQQQGKSHIAKDIDLTNAVTTMRIEDTPTGLIMNEAGARYIVNNEPSDIRPVQPNENQTSLVVADPQLQEVISRLQSAGEFNVDVLTESGITKVIVATTSDDRQVDSLCFTVDLNGVCQTTGRKMWFGLPLIPDFEPSYVFDNNAVEALLTGEGQELLNPVFNKNSCDLNKIVDLRSIFDIEGITNDDALTLMRTIKGLMAKRAMKIELQKKENDGIRFSVAAYKDPANFRLILKDRTYQYTGGPITTNKGKSSYVVVENGRMKFCNTKSKQTQQKQTQTLEDTAEAINKRFAEANKEYKDLTGQPHGMVNLSTHEAMQGQQVVVTA